MSMSLREIAACVLDEWNNGTEENDMAESVDGSIEAEAEDFDFKASMSKLGRNAAGFFKDSASGAKANGIGNGGMPTDAAGVSVDLVAHDRKNHPGGYHGGRCKYRKQMAKTIQATGVTQGMTPEQLEGLKNSVGAENWEAGAGEAKSDETNGNIDAELKEIKDLERKRNMETDPELKKKLQDDLDAKRDAYYKRNMRDAEYDAMKELENCISQGGEMVDKIASVAQKIIDNFGNDKVTRDAAEHLQEEVEKKREENKVAINEAIKAAGSKEGLKNRAESKRNSAVNKAMEKFSVDGDAGKRDEAIAKAQEKYKADLEKANIKTDSQTGNSGNKNGKKTRDDLAKEEEDAAAEYEKAITDGASEEEIESLRRKMKRASSERKSREEFPTREDLLEDLNKRRGELHSAQEKFDFLKQVDPATGDAVGSEEEIKAAERAVESAQEKVDGATKRFRDFKPNEYFVNGKKYVDTAKMGFLDGMVAALKAGWDGKNVVTEWDKTSGRWDNIKANGRFDQSLDALKGATADVWMETKFGKLMKENAENENIPEEERRIAAAAVDALASGTPSMKVCEFFTKQMMQLAKSKQAKDNGNKQKVKSAFTPIPDETDMTEEEKELKDAADAAFRYGAHEEDMNNAPEPSQDEKDFLAARDAIYQDQANGTITANEANQRIVELERKFKDERGFEMPKFDKKAWSQTVRGFNPDSAFADLPPEETKINADIDRKNKESKTVISDVLSQIFNGHNNVQVSVSDPINGVGETKFKLSLPHGVDARSVESKIDMIKQRLGTNAIKFDKNTGPNECAITIPSAQRHYSVKDYFKNPEAKKFIDNSILPVVGGFNSDGSVDGFDMTNSESPNIMVVGGTGSGKTELGEANLQLWLTKDHRYVQPWLLDGKGGLGGMYKDVKGLTVASPNQINHALKRLVAECKRRQSLFDKYKVRDIKAWNAKFPNKPMPYVPVLYDEVNAANRINSENDAVLRELSAICRAAGINVLGTAQSLGVGDGKPGSISVQTEQNMTSSGQAKIVLKCDANSARRAGVPEAELSPGNGKGYIVREGKATPVQSAYSKNNDKAAFVRWANSDNRKVDPPTNPHPQNPTPPSGNPPPAEPQYSYSDLAKSMPEDRAEFNKSMIRANGGDGNGALEKSLNALTDDEHKALRDLVKTAGDSSGEFESKLGDFFNSRFNRDGTRKQKEANAMTDNEIDDEIQKLN